MQRLYTDCKINNDCARNTLFFKILVVFEYKFVVLFELDRQIYNVKIIIPNIIRILSKLQYLQLATAILDTAGERKSY